MPRLKRLVRNRSTPHSDESRAQAIESARMDAQERIRKVWRGEQFVNNILPNTVEQRVEVRSATTWNQQDNQFSSTYEPGGRRFESCWARQWNQQLNELWCANNHAAHPAGSRHS
jgi:hypothetical protein